jgi:hypothetical protein
MYQACPKRYPQNVMQKEMNLACDPVVWLHGQEVTMQTIEPNLMSLL